MERIRRGWQLMRQSATVLRQDPELLVLPLVGLVGALAIDAALWALLVRRMPEARDVRASAWWRVLPLLVVGSIVPTFTNTALVAAAGQRLDGQDPTLRSSLRVAWRRWPQILGWTLLSGVVALVLQLLVERLKLAGRVAQLTIGLSWALATFFVIPVLVFEPVGVTDAVKRSAELFMERWGEEATLMGGLGVVSVVAVLPLLVIGSVVAPFAPAVGISIMVVGTLAVMIATGALSGVYTTALYRYALDGTASGPFTPASLEASFGQKKAHWWNRRKTKDARRR